ncbi:4'-phosphopantetheinyl transferase superfamily protein [Flavicella sp.]|uniref:4'-phosphopantetheinyl transferase family protein n=1 Tax=Flavicella sp. TaxID=2957742 RepID=UPI00261FA845|nr:4'-phosphopantetheinyl transferase superfamily protein [Flavicella sp.]MDG1804540.1 4'-phosphopantetheinyl transferase superfamily protein [Flavicella sp.]
MPLAKTITVDKNTTVLVWKITETLQELKTIFLSANSIARLTNMRSELHQKGFISVRHLLKKAGYSDADLFYSETGKPNLKDGKHISISHSFTYSTVIISDKCVGIDIEKNRDKIKRIAHKFVGSESSFLTDENLIEQLTVLWGAKESLYKIHPKGGLLFREHLPIDPFVLTHKKTTGWIKKHPWNEPYAIEFDFIDGFTLAYAIPLD